MEISNPRLTGSNHTDFVDRIRAGLKARAPFADIKLGCSQHSGRKGDYSPRIKRAAGTEHSHYPLIQGLLLDLLASSTKFVFRLLYPILLLCASGT
jgi:hypothetical protein